MDREPYIPKLRENNVRKGYVENSRFGALRDHLPEYLQGPATFACKTGGRVAEIFNLRWDQVDLQDDNVGLNAGETKKDYGPPAR